MIIALAWSFIAAFQTLTIPRREPVGTLLAMAFEVKVINAAQKLHRGGG